MHDLNWDDLRFILAIARAGTIRAAADHLRLNHATVSRHVAQLQEELGVRLFERRGRTLSLTNAGAELVETARQIEQQVVAVGRKLSGGDVRLHGNVRIALTDSLAAVVAPALPGFAAEHPGISLELATGLSFKSLTQMEADIAVRVVSQPQDSLVGRKLAAFEVAAFASRSLLADVQPSRVADYPWIGWTDAFRAFPMEAWLRERLPEAHVSVRADSEIALWNLVKAGVGAAFIPAVLGHSDPSLRRVGPREGIPSFWSTLWILTHEDLRHTRRVQVVSAWLRETLGARFAALPTTAEEARRLTDASL